MDEWIYSFLSHGSTLSSFVLLLVLLFSTKMAYSIIWKAIFVLCIISITANLLSVVFAKVYQNNIPIFHGYIAIEFVIFGVLYFHIFSHKWVKIFISIYLLGYVSLFCWFFMFQSNIWEVHIGPRVFSNVFLVFLSVSYFAKVFKEMKHVSLLNDVFFWFNTAVLFYFGTTFYIVIFEGFIRSYEYDLLLYTWPVQLISMIIYNLILAKGIWTMRKLSS